MAELEENKNSSLQFKQVSSTTAVYLDAEEREVLRIRQGRSAVFIRRRKYDEFGVFQEELLKETTAERHARVDLLRKRTFAKRDLFSAIERIDESFLNGAVSKKIYTRVFDGLRFNSHKRHLKTQEAISSWSKVYEVSTDRIVTEFDLAGRIVRESYPNNKAVFLACNEKQYQHSICRSEKSGERTEFFRASGNLQDKNQLTNCLEKTYWKGGCIKRIYAYQAQNGHLLRTLFFEEYDVQGRPQTKVGQHKINLGARINLSNRQRND